MVPVFSNLADKPSQLQFYALSSNVSITLSSPRAVYNQRHEFFRRRHHSLRNVDVNGAGRGVTVSRRIFLTCKIDVERLPFSRTFNILKSRTETPWKRRMRFSIKRRRGLVIKVRMFDLEEILVRRMPLPTPATRKKQRRRDLDSDANIPHYMPLASRAIDRSSDLPCSPRSLVVSPLVV